MSNERDFKSNAQADNTQPRPEKEEILLTQFRQLREEIRTHAKRKGRRVTRGIAAIAVLLGYSVYDKGDPRVLAVVPVVIGLLFISHVLSVMWVVRAARQIVKIQQKIDVTGFGYEKNYGVLSQNHDRRVNQLPDSVMYLIITVTYLLSVVAGVNAIDRNGMPELLVTLPDSPSILTLSPAGWIALSGYVVFTVLLAVVALCYFCVIHVHKSEIRDHVEEPWLLSIAVAWVSSKQ